MNRILLGFVHVQVGDDTFGRSTLHNFKDNLVNAGMQTV